MSQNSVQIGPFTVGEKPVPLDYQFQDSNGNAIDLTGYTVKFVVHEQFGLLQTFNASLVSGGSTGHVSYTWTANEYPTPGHYRARFWAGNNAQRFASVLILFDVADAEGPVPQI